MQIIDSDLTPGCKSSRMITRVDYKEIYPNAEHERSLNYIFRYKIPTEVPDEQGKVLLKKYPTLHIRSDSTEITTDVSKLKLKLDGLKWNDLKKYAVENCDMTYQETNIKREQLTATMLEKME